MTVDLGTIIAGLALVVGAVVWLVRLEGRINVTESQFSEIIRRLDRMERRQDEHGRAGR